MKKLPKVSIKDLRHTGRKSPWCVIYYNDRDAVKKYFKTKAEAEVYKEELTQHWRNGTSPESQEEVSRFVLNSGYDVMTLLKVGWDTLRSNGSLSVSPTMLFSDAVKAYIVRQDRKRIKDISKEKSRSLLHCLNKTFGGRIVTGITEQEVREFLNNLRNRHGTAGKATTNTKKNYFMLIKGILLIAGITNPLPGLEKPVPSMEEKKVKFFPVPDIATIFRCAKREERGMLALAIFWGMRPYLVQALPVDCVDPIAKTITIPEWLAKDGKEHPLETEVTVGDRYIVGMPEALWPWLKVFPFKPCPWDEMVARIGEQLGYWIQDGCRHSGATFYTKLRGWAAGGRFLTHEGLSLVMKHYVGICSRQQAEAFFALDPLDFLDEPVPAPTAPKAIAWPSDADLAKMLQEKSAMQVARDLDCSDVAIWKRCKARGIDKPGRGEWTKRNFGNALDSDMSFTGEQPAA